MAKRRVLLTWDGKEEALTPLQTIPPRCDIEESVAHSDRAAGAELSPPTNRVIRGDALHVARALEEEGFAGQVDLVYLDPPYASGVDYEHEERFDGRKSGRVTKTAAYGDRWDDAASYLDMLYPRLTVLARLLKPTGTLWVQVDWRANHYVRALCDEILGRDRFLNEIVWRRAPNLGRQARSGQFGRTLDTIIVYGASPHARIVPPERPFPVQKRAARRDPDSGRWFTVAPRGDYTDASIAKLESEGRVHRSRAGTIAVKYFLEEGSKGELFRNRPVDTLWTDVLPLRHAQTDERTGYPTQKPRALLERIIVAASPPEGLIVDLFAGSGTTGAAASRLGRRFILGDESPVAIATLRSRLLRDGVTPLTIERCGTSAPSRDATIEAHPRGKAEMEVTLVPANDEEPMAWALDLSGNADAPFHADWHAERGAGRKPADLRRTAVVARTSSVVRARIYFVDGKVATARISLATHPKSEPKSWIEAPP